jgi:hypothetical protein
MGFFSKIKDAIFGKAKAATPPPTAPSAPAPTAAPADPAPITVVDVEEILDELSANTEQKLNWRTSIVDLLKLLSLDSSLAERKGLAQELGYTGALDGSAEMNIWLHKRVMQEIAANGGSVPASLID